MENLRDKLKDHIIYEEGKKIRKELNEYARQNYVPKYDLSEYLRFMNNNECTFLINHPQGSNFPYYWTMFSIISQHVRGDCIEECLDNAIELEKKGTFTHLKKDHNQE